MKRVPHPWWHFFFSHYSWSTIKSWSNYDGSLVEHKTTFKAECSKCKKIFTQEIDRMKTKYEVVKL
jgi:hypothetical protein